jgi:hypothetical protein
MAKKSNSISNASLLSTLAFWGLFFAALIFVVVGALRLFGLTGGILIGILEIVAKVLLLVAVAIPAYGYVNGKKKAWKIVYWIALVVYALGVVFGVIGYIK